MNTNTPVDYADVQGLVRFAHGHLSNACFLLLQVADPRRAREWLADAPITNAQSATPRPTTAMQIAFTAAGLRALGINESVIEEMSPEFVAGIARDPNHSRRLGDIGSNAPGEWQWGGDGGAELHVLLMLYGTAEAFEAWQQDVRDTAFEGAFNVVETINTTTRSAHEPFGFVDGISQPLIDWQQSAQTDKNHAVDFTNLVALGEVVLGYSNAYGQYTSRPLLDPAIDATAKLLAPARDNRQRRDFGLNGTYLVLRQLEQDAHGFWQYLDRAADSDARERERLAALMVGRQRDGTPLIDLSSTAIPGIADDAAHAKLNNFSFDEDLEGLQCPIGAHVRRSNPRTGDYPPNVRGLVARLLRSLGFGRRQVHDDLVASTRFHRILRRGRVYGTPVTVEQALKSNPGPHACGLQFVALGANISRQFEFVQNAWIASASFAGLNRESDPLLGQRGPLAGGIPTDTFTAPQKRGAALCLRSLPQFVRVRGGGYFFMPGLRALRYIAAQGGGDTAEEDR